MRRTRFLVSLSLGLCIVVFIFTVGDYLALHDIASDYVSKDVLQTLEVTAELPAWTETRGEWGMVNLSGFSRLFFLAINAVTLVFCLKAMQSVPASDKGAMRR